MDSDETSSGSVPVSSGKDTLQAFLRAGIAAVPLVGGSAVELFSHFVASPLSKRRDRWFEDVGMRLYALEESSEGLLVELQSDPAFVDILLHASNIAVRTASEHKRVALLNAVVNSAERGKPDDAERALFLDYVDRFTEWHLRILGLYHDPRVWAEQNRVEFPVGSMPTSLTVLIETAFPELAERRDFYDQVWSQLRQSGLVSTDSLQGMMSGSGLMSSRSTDLGKRFLAFISET